MYVSGGSRTHDLLETFANIHNMRGVLILAIYTKREDISLQNIACLTA